MFLTYVSYLVIWLVTDRLDTITPSLLGLMGISAGTALSEALIDSSKDTARSEQRRGLSAERQALEQTVTDLQSERAELGSGTTMSSGDLANRDSLSKQIQVGRMRLAQAGQQFSSLESTTSARATRGFLRDVMADRDGYSFHRFQIFAWTIVLGIMFMSSVYNSLAMPEFSATLFGLMGLSSGTYIGFKFPEETKIAADPQPAWLLRQIRTNQVRGFGELPGRNLDSLSALRICAWIVRGAPFDVRRHRMSRVAAGLCPNRSLSAGARHGNGSAVFLVR